MSETAREVVARVIDDSYVQADMLAEEVADAVLAALREHWTSEDERKRIYLATPGFQSTSNFGRAVIAALFEEGP